MNTEKIKFAPIEMMSAIDTVTTLEKKEVTDFLHEHLDEFGDPKEDILNCLEYALSDRPHQGGFILIQRHSSKIVSVVVMNKTGMSGYIPENILVYIAVHRDFRGMGLGQRMMKEAISRVNGDIALHVEPDNPAKRLYEKMGFDNKYLEMRLKNK